MIRFFSRLRFLPLTIFAASLMLTVKIGHIWEGLDGMLMGAVSVAGAEAQQPGAAPAVPQQQKAAQTPLPGVATPGNAPAAAASAAKTPANAPAAAKAPAGAAPAGSAPAATAAKAPPAGTAAPGAPSGNAAPGAPSGNAAAADKPATMQVTDPTLLTQSEIDLLQQLAERRDVIESREREITVREGMMKAAESRIDKKIQEMKVLQATVEKLIAQYNDQQAAKIASLVKIYENMKPKDAARIFEALDMDTLLLVAERMKERSLAPIMANMDPNKARDVTVDLAKRRQLPQAATAGG